MDPWGGVLPVVCVGRASSAIGDTVADYCEDFALGWQPSFDATNEIPRDYVRLIKILVIQDLPVICALQRSVCNALCIDPIPQSKI